MIEEKKVFDNKKRKTITIISIIVIIVSLIALTIFLIVKKNQNEKPKSVEPLNNTSNPIFSTAQWTYKVNNKEVYFEDLYENEIINCEFMYSYINTPISFYNGKVIIGDGFEFVSVEKNADWDTSIDESLKFTSIYIGKEVYGVSVSEGVISIKVKVKKGFNEDNTFLTLDKQIVESKDKKYFIDAKTTKIANKANYVKQSTFVVYEIKRGSKTYYEVSDGIIDDAKKVIRTYNCKSKDCNLLTYNLNEHVLYIYDENIYFSLNFLTNATKKINITTNSNITSAQFVNTNSSFGGLILYYENGHENFYNFKTNELLFDYEVPHLEEYELIEDGYISYDWCGIIYPCKGEIINVDTKEIIFSAPIEENQELTIVKNETGQSFFALTNFGIEYSYNFLNKDGEIINNESTFDYYLTESGNLILPYDGYTDENYYFKYNKYAIYNSDGALLKTSEAIYQEILSLYKDYFVALQDGKLKLFDYEENEVVSFCDWNDKLNFHSYLSGMWSYKDKHGIFLVVEDPNTKIEELIRDNPDMAEEEIRQLGNAYGYEYYYIPTTGEVGKIATFIGGYAKPVLYLYPSENNTRININFAHPKLLTTTYPKYNSSWSVVANTNGDLYDENGRYYYGLYWEESGSINVDFKTGFYVSKENAISFLEEKLNILGFSEREANEFIMYWLPILEKNEKSLVYFELTNSREKYNKLLIEPKPDSLLRVAIHVKKVNKYTKIESQVLPTFKRHGFTAIEWGGVQH